MCWDTLLTNDRELSKSVLHTQRWLDGNSRDILDESDELLGVGWELVYTVGQPALILGQPDRWLIAQEVLSLVSRGAAAAYSKCLTGIEYEPPRQGAFPNLRILNEEGGKVLTALLLDDIHNGNLSDLSMAHFKRDVKQAIHNFISVRNVDDLSYHTVLEHFQNSAQLTTPFLLRGFIANGILQLALQKRRIVQYGLRSNCLSAVPYRAKSIPAPTAEFAQPELMILLTALSYYLGGVSKGDFHSSVMLLMKATEPEHEFAKWIEGSTLPSTLRSVNAVNLDDQLCMTQLFDHLRYGKACIDFFLSHIVYPREAKDFSQKLSTSAWDLCSADAATITSGFSGTNDNKSLLPLSIEQKELPELKHTNAIVLAALLKPENKKYICTADSARLRLSTAHLLDVIVAQEPSPCVLIDVGAQVLNLTNQQLASAWLSLRRDKQAAVFYNDDDERTVLNQDGSLDTWLSSPFRDRLEACLIVLDQFHTRGTDFKLPDGYAAAVTLGPGLTKDTFAQAVMRMRKLGFTQSIVIMSPPEVDDSIRVLIGQSHSYTITIADVIRWVISQSCSAIKNLSPLFVMRGMAHSQRRFAERAYFQSRESSRDAQTYFAAIQERESKPVSELYQVPQKGQTWIPYKFAPNEQRDEIVQQLLLQVRTIDNTAFQDSGKQEEQEREVLHEVEQEREVQRPRSNQPCTAKLTNSLLPLVRSGIVPVSTDPEIAPAFSLLQRSSAETKYEPDAWGNDLRATADFCRTVDLSRGSMIDDFLRPANWVLSSRHTTTLFLISPHEANEILPEIRKSHHVTLHMYTPRVSMSMPSFNQLDYYCVPAMNVHQLPNVKSKVLLSLFAGQLYISNLAEYIRLCQFLGIVDGIRILDDEHLEVAADGFVSASCRSVNGWATDFQESPISFVKELVRMRRKGLDFGHTHLGRIVNGKTLRAADFQ